MAGKTLHLKGLTADLNDQIKGRLELYFSNKRKSGGVISELRADPTDRRSALLVYDDDQALTNVLSKKTHQVDLRGSLGVVTLSVTLPEDVKAETVLSSESVFVRRREEVESLVKEIKMKKARDELQIFNNTIEKEIQLDSKERLDLTVDNVQDELEMLCVELSKDIENLTIHLKGPSEKVQKGEAFIQKFQDTLSSKKLDTSNIRIQFWQFVDLQKFQNEHFSQDNIVAVVIRSRQSVSVLAKKCDIERAEKKIEDVIKQEGIPISGEYEKERFGEQWETFHADLTKELESTQNHQNIFINFSGDKIELCGFRSVVDDVLAKVKTCLENKKLVTEIVALKTVQEVNFVESKLSADSQLKALGATILPCRSSQSPCLQVTATSDQIKKALDVVNMHTSQITTRRYIYSKAGEATILKKNTLLLKTQAKGFGCNLGVSKVRRKPLIYDLKGGVTLTLSQGDIAKQTSDALICPLVNMCFNNPIAQQFLEYGGPGIKNAIHALQKLNQSLEAGNVILTYPGSLKPRKLLFAAIPVWGKNNSALNSTHLEAAVLHSLLKGSNSQCVSVGLPALGCGTFGFPLRDSCEAIMKGIRSFISLGCGNLTSIHLTESDPKIVKGFKSALETLGYRPTDPTKTRTPLSPSSSGSPSLLVSNTIVIAGISVILKKADITQENADVIVNSNNHNLDLNTGASGAILNAAGQSVIDECKKHSPQAVGNVVLTGGGNLNCKYIAQIAGPAHTTAAILNVLQLCESKKAATMSMPSIGTGRGGSTPEESAKAILQAVKMHMLSIPISSFKKIFVVAFEDGIYDRMKKYFNKQHSHSKTQKAGTQMNSGRVTTLGLPLNQVKIKDTLIELKKGNITEENVKAIVNSTNKDMNRNIGVSGAILNAAGAAVEAECAKIRPLKDNDAAVTSGGSLQCDFIIHIVGPINMTQAYLRVKNVLEHCEDQKIATVSFPAVGTGDGGMEIRVSISALLFGIKQHLSQHNVSSLKQIFLVVDQDLGILECQKSLLRWTQRMADKDDSIEDSSSDEDTSGAQISAPQGGAEPSTTQPSLCLATACRAVSFPKVKVMVLGWCSSDVEKVQKLVDDLVANQRKSFPISSPLLSQLLESEKQAIVDLSRRLHVCVRLLTQDKATASGKTEDVLLMVLQMEKYLQSANERVARQGEEKRLRETVHWEVSDREAWAELDPTVSLDLEKALYEKEPSISYTEQQQTYTVNLDKMERTDGNGTIAKIRRTLMAGSEIAVIELPANWNRMDNKTMDIVDLPPASKEYKAVQENFLKTSQDQPTPATFTVVKIQRIQNIEQWRRYAVKKQMLDKKYPKAKNEMNLYHGTTAVICQNVNSNGFNRGYCGRNAILYGKGTYFAKESWYSCNDTYSTPDVQGVKYMYQARVLVGKPCLGLQGMVEPTPLDPANLQSGLHDCAVDNMQSPFIYVVFCDAGAYPEYLISFKAS